jgi:hypothetical protein
MSRDMNLPGTARMKTCDTMVRTGEGCDPVDPVAELGDASTGEEPNGDGQWV